MSFDNNTIKYLYYTESASNGGQLTTDKSVMWLDVNLGLYGGQRMCVHPIDADYPTTSDESYNTIEEAQNQYPNHTWIHLDPNAEVFLDELEHPLENVVYTVGHDAYGYGSAVLKGTKCKLRAAHFSNPETNETHAMVALLAALFDRWIRNKPWL